MDIKDSPVWSRLSYVSCASNGLVLMDESLQLLPAVETLDLSRNQFAKVDNLRKCTKLRNLDLGFNHLRSISYLSEVHSRVGKLVLRNNALTTIRGIENLKSLVGLDLSYNIISNFSELEILGSLSLLENLWLEGNPICCARWYRAHVFSFFHNSENLKLDDKGMNTQEYWEKQVMFSSRQKQPAGYGFYFPAKDDCEDEDTSKSMMVLKKISRLACIVEEERSLCDEGVDLQSTPRDSDSSKKDEVSAADGDIQITSLISTAELMKKERSTVWLREFKEWMDENTDNNTEGDRLYADFTNKNRRQKRQNGRQKSHMKRSKSVTDLAQTSEGGSSSNLLESDLSFTDGACNGVTTESPIEVNAEPDHLRVHLNSVQQLPPLEFVGTSHSDSFSELEDGSNILHANGTPSHAMSKLIGPSPSFAYPSPQSPPQYKEDILRRRLFLEEEFLQSSGDFQCVGSLGSGSSCSDDSSGDLCSCNSEDDCVAIQTKMELALNDQMASFPYADSDHEEKDGEEYLSQVGSLSDSSAEDDPTYTDAIEFGTKELHDRKQMNGHVGQHSGHLGRQNGKQKFKRRIVPIFKNQNGSKLEFLKTNGDEMDEEVSVGENGHLRYDLKSTTCKDQHSEKHISSILHKDNLSIGADTVSSNTRRGKYKLIEDFFNVEVANKEESEICEQGARCGYMFQDGSDLVQREVALLRSSQNKLYVLLVDMAQDEREIMPRVLGCYRLEHLEKVLIGLGLQVLRMHMTDHTAHLFLARTPKEAQDVLWLLNLFSFPQLTNGVSLQSWEKIQIKSLEKCICASMKMGIFFYSMLMFWKNDAEEECLVIRSLIVTEGSIFVCIEDLYRFGCFPDDSYPPYFSLDEYCSIKNIKELVMDQRDNKCLTLVLDKHIHEGRSHSTTKNSQNKQADAIYKIQSWKLKWFAEETLMKFISVLRALYSTAGSSSLPVKWIS